MTVETAARRWADALAEWAVPAELLAAVPEPPWALRPAMFATVQPDPTTPTAVRAREALGAGGSERAGGVVLDVGAGTGAASLGLVPPASRVIAVDHRPEMLSALGERAAALGVDHRLVPGRWPDVATSAGVADIVVCSHVVYDVADIAPFVAALDAAARKRVVLELTAVHPHTAYSKLWLALHGIVRPTRPTAHDLLDVLSELGIDPNVQWWELPPLPSHETRAEQIAALARRVCVPAHRYAELDAILDDAYVNDPREAATVWWDRPMRMV